MRKYMIRTTIKLTIVLFLALAVCETVWASQVKLDVAMSTPVLLVNENNKAYLQVGMTGFEFKNPNERPPVNVAIVLDKSGSMTGTKIARAKEAAIMAIDRLRNDDIVSVITYDTTVCVVIPATKVSDRERIRSRIRTINASGNTALFAGMSKGAAEIRKFLDKGRVNRIVLLSDGLANVGPSSPADLAELGTSLSAEGIAVTTIGLGLDFNEDLMTALAENSDGNHMFAENAVDLARAFDAEFGDVLSVVAQDVTVRIECADGVRPVRVLGRKADVAGQIVISSLRQLYARQMKYVMLEVEIEPGVAGSEKLVASVDVSYANMATHTTDKLQSSVSTRFTDSATEVTKNTNKDVMVEVIDQIGMENAEAAMKLRDEGKIEEARQKFDANKLFIDTSNAPFLSEKLDKRAFSNTLWSESLDEKEWKKARKSVKGEQFKVQNQQIDN